MCRNGGKSAKSPLLCQKSPLLGEVLHELFSYAEAKKEYFRGNPSDDEEGNHEDISGVTGRRQNDP